MLLADDLRLDSLFAVFTMLTCAVAMLPQSGPLAEASGL
jgi:hypothetical protein